MTLPNNPTFEYKLSGVSGDLSLGKNGPRLLNSNGSVEFVTFDGQPGNITVNQGFFANIGVGTAQAYYPVDIYGNIHISNTTSTTSGIIWPDGTFQTTAAYYTPPGGSNGSVQFNQGNLFTGNSLFSFDDANVRLGIGTGTPASTLSVYGNIQIADSAGDNNGIVFPDGSFQNTATKNTPSFGPPGTVQFAGVGNSFSGDSSSFFWNTSNSTLISSSLFLTSNIASNDIFSGALVVQGGVGISGDLHVAGNIFGSNVSVITGNSGVFYGDSEGFGAIYGGIPMGYTYQPNTVLQLSANANDYAQLNIQNVNYRFAASTDIVATADNGNANDTYIDMGINSSQFFQATIDGANDGYLYVAGNAVTGGGNLVLGTLAANDIIFAQGGAAYGNEVARFVYGQGLILELNTASYSTGTGALVVSGGVGINGNLNVGNAASVGSIFSNSTIQSAGQATVNSLIANANISSANINIAATGWLGNVYSNGFTQTAGITVTNQLISNTSIYAANLNVAGLLRAGNIYSNGFTQTAGLSVANQIISNSNIYGANLNIQGTAWAGNVYSNGTIQSTGLATVNQLISNANISGANLNISGTAWLGNVYSNGFSQTAGLAVVNQLISNSNIFGSNLNVQGPASVGSLISNNTIQASGTATVNALYANTVVQTATINATSSAQVNSLQSNISIQTPGPVTAGSVNSNGAIVGQSINSNGAIQAAGTAIVNALYSNSSIQAAGSLTVNSLNSNGSIVGSSLTSNGTIQAAGTVIAAAITSNSTIQSAGAATVASLVSNSTIQSAGVATVSALISNNNVYGATLQSSGLATVDSLVVNNNSTTSTLVVRNGAQVNTLSSNTAISANGLISGQQIRSNGFIEGQTLKTTGIAVVQQFVSNTEATANTLNIITNAVVQTITSNTSIQAATSVLANTINSNLSITSPAINALNQLSSNTIVSNVGITAANIAASGVVTITNNTASGSTGSGALIVTGGVGIGGNLNVGGQQSLFAGNLIVSGNFIVRGNSTIVNSNTISVTGPTIEVGSDNGEGNVLVNNDGYDRGVIMNYFVLNDNNAFMGWQNSTGRFVFLTNVQPGVSNLVNPFESVPGYVYGAAHFGDLLLSNTTVSINSTSGALVVNGGVGIGGSVNAIGQIATTGQGRFGQDLLANQLNSNAAISAVGTITGSSIHANNEVSSTNMSATNSISAALIAANNSVTSASVTALNNITGNILVGNVAVISPYLQALNQVTAQNIIANSSVVTTTLITGGLAQVNALNSNTNVSANDISAVNRISANVIAANVAIAVPSLTVSGTITGNNIVANSTIGTTELYVADVATVNSLVSNTTVNVDTINSNLIYNSSYLYTARIQAANRITGNTIVSNGVVSGDFVQGITGVNGGFVTSNSYIIGDRIISNSYVAAQSIDVTDSALINLLFVNTDVYSNTLVARFGIIGDYITSNTGIQSTGLILADQLHANVAISTPQSLYAGTIYANTNIQSAGPVVATSIFSNTTVQSPGAGEFGSITSNGIVQAGLTVIGAAFISNSSVQANGAIVGSSITSNTFVIAASQIMGQSLVSNSTIQSAGTTTVNALVSNTTIQAAGTANVGNLITSGTVTLLGGNITGVNTLFTHNVIANGLISAPNFSSNSFISNSNIGIGTSVVNYPLDVYGNIHIGNTAAISGILFSDGTFQNTAAAYTPSFGSPYTIQFAGNSNTFSGDSTHLAWDVANLALNTSNLEVVNSANIGLNASIGNNIYLVGNLNGSNTTIMQGKTAILQGGAGGFGALYAGVQDYTNYQPNTVALFAGNINGTVQVGVHNDSSGASASGDLVITADNGNANDTYIDLGINSSGWNNTTVDRANDGYLFVHGNTATGGGNLVLGTMLNNDIVFTQGGNAAAKQVARFVYGQGLLINSTVNSANLSVASLVTSGGAAIGLNALIGGNLTASYGTAGTVTIGGDPNGSIEIGQQGRATPGTPYIDFHSSASSNDYDARIQASGGSAAGIGQANLSLFASNVNVNANLAVYGNLHAYTADVGSLTQINSIGFANVQVLKSNGYVSGNTWVIDGNAHTSSSTFQQVVDSWPTAAYRSAQYMLQITDTTTNSYQVSQLLLLQDGTNVYFTEYADIYTATSLGTWSADIASGTVALLFTPYSSDNLSIKVVRTAIDI